ncbi:lipopolysaccharide kinase InaA family protein [Actomonas aquatica]|uniref:Lipopolysaccharide kinase InaA family protein n=1 Tax=Actomonas aquatica TaxID=2866162 RepID=A0ABZ1C9W7_9BACT|nr:lipopolysaccharide kinase InaA family protein [Opitutus sp. WL0086]WRQ88484.1 lipopolysaccharide kinase InaA family protein [Opitutus sp. WL0086]
MSIGPSRPDYGPALHAMIARIDAELGSPAQPSRQLTTAPAAPTSRSWRQLEEAAERFAAAWTSRRDGLGSFKRIGRATIEADNTVVATTKPWEFQGWLPFASRRVLRLNGALAEVELEVTQGEVGIAILADDGSQFVGKRYVATVGRHQLQLPIRSDEVKGIVFCSTDAVETPARFCIRRTALLKIDPESPAAQHLREQFLAAGNPPPETDDPDAVPATVPLVLFHLLGQGKLHAVRALLHAARQLTGDTPAWFPARLSELLQQFDGLKDRGDQPTAVPPATTTPTPSTSPEPTERAAAELLALRHLTTGADLVPLQLELLEFGFTLDLIGSVHAKPLQFTWQRQALASTLVPRGLLASLLAVIGDRLRGDLQSLRVEASTTTTGTELWLHSDLAHGDLQYRDFTGNAAALHHHLNDPRCASPRLEHRLGEENAIGLIWPDTNEEADLPDLSWTAGDDVAATTQLYIGQNGGEIRRRGGLCYKLSPTESTKPNDLVDEAKLSRQLAELDFVVPVLSAHRWPEGSAMSYPFQAGTTLAQAALDATPAPVDQPAIIRQVTDALVELNQRGIQHRDVRAENILLRPDGTIVVLDFDQARPHADADDFGNEWDAEAVCAGFGGMLRQLHWERDYLATAGQLGFAWELGRHSAANSPGKHACYYAWRWGPLALEGERPWSLRWQLLRPAFRREGVAPGRFLELGANLGLLSTYASLEGWEARGIERDGVAVTAAQRIAATLGASSQFSRGDLTSPALFADLDDTYDMVSALSVVHWLPDPAPVEAFLRRQPRLLFEGHRAIADEEAYLHELGFETVSLLGYSERLRPILLATRAS